MSIIFNNTPVSPLRITSKFGPRNTGIKGASTYHKGVDIGRDFSKPSTNIVAVADGVVFNNFWNDYKGWVVIIDHGDFKTLYQHLDSKSGLSKGQKVSSGQLVGIMGNSSNPSKLKVAIHLHFELIVNGKQIDPMPYLQNIKPKLQSKPAVDNHIKDANELYNEIAKQIQITNKNDLVNALNEYYNTSIWWVIKKLLSCNYNNTKPINGGMDIYRRTLKAISISDIASYNNGLLQIKQNSLFWVIKKLLDKLGVM